MQTTGEMLTLNMGSYTNFAVIAGLTLLVATNDAAPGCTGPAVEQCDYVAAFKTALLNKPYRYNPKLGIEAFDQGSSVHVQQFIEGVDIGFGSAVLVDKQSCRACRVGQSERTPDVPFDAPRGTLLLRTQPEDAVGGAQFAREIQALFRDG